MWILLERSILEKFKNSDNYSYLFPINKNNFFIGKNNSGKSYFMRFIMKNMRKVYFTKKQLIDEIKDAILEPNVEMNFFKNINILEIQNVYKKFKRYIDILQKIISSGIENGIETLGSVRYKNHNYTNASELLNEAEPLMKFLELGDNYSTKTFDSEVYIKKQEIMNKINTEFKKNVLEVLDVIDDKNIHLLGEFLNEINFIETRETNNNIIYIPIIRGLRNPIKDIGSTEIQKDIYKNRIISEYGFKDNINVITGLDFYFSYKSNLLGNKENRKSVNQFEKFLSDYFFDGADISIIPDEKTFELKININDDNEDKFIYEVGDGISSMIILMYPIFIESTEDEYKLFFIEEPENSFHPGFQRLFITILTDLKKFEKSIFFFSTHSNHLIDIGTNELLNSNVYMCKKNKNNSIEINFQDQEYNEVIEELGVQASSVRIANKVIWVEGKYDAFYIRLLLKLKDLNKKYIEDYDFCFLPYGGSNMKLINFNKQDSEEKNQEFISKARKINPNFLVILDDDNMEKNKSSEKYKRYKNLKDILGNSIFKLNVREVENLFPEEVVKKFIKNNIIDDSKIEEMNINFHDYKNQKLGNYINNKLKVVYGDTSYKKITGRENGFEKEGFLYDKQKYYEAVLEWTRKKDFSYEKDITDEAKELINVIEKFLNK